MSKEIKTKSKRMFLKRLAALQDEYNVDICSRKTGEYSEVFFQIHDFRKGKSHNKENINTGRLHNSAYEIRNISKEY
jgi:diphthamide synthase (EF-2-diphthine--ammonia ligase)